MTGPPESNELPTVTVPLCVVEIIQEVSSVDAADVAAQTERLEPTRDGDEALGFLEPFFQQLVTLWLRKSKQSQAAAEAENFHLANKLLNEVSFLYSILDFYVYNSSAARDETRSWSVCQGFLLVLRDAEEDEIEVELDEDDDADDDDVDRVPHHKPVDKKKLH